MVFHVELSGRRRHKDVLVFFGERDALLRLWGVVDVVGPCKSVPHVDGVELAPVHSI